jgi:ectoine hydroxylase-related dioxygenase (phytanoyl-CoA dioxygenase family)
MHDRRMALSNDQRAHFESHGWLVLRAIVSRSDLSELNRTFDDLMMPFAPAPGDGRSGVLQRPTAYQTNGAMFRHLHDGVAAIACALLGAPSVQLLQHTLLLKHPSVAGSIPLHQDYSYTGYLDPPSSLSVGLALNDATVESGCLYVIDGSHTWGLVSGFHVFADELQQDLDNRLSPAQRARVQRAKVSVEVQAGDVTIHHCLILHGSGDNTTDRPRKAIVTHLFSGDCKLVRERLRREAHHRFTTDDQGRLTALAFPTLYATAIVRRGENATRVETS